MKKTPNRLKLLDLFVALMIAFVVMAELIGAELILGAFLAGVLASLLSEPEDEKLRYKLDAIGFGFFVPLFFVYVGVRFDLQAFLNNQEACPCRNCFESRRHTHRRARLW